MEHSDNIGQLAAAKAKAQVQFLAIKRAESAEVQMRSGGKYSYTYADLASCLESVVPALSEHALALFQPVRVIPGPAMTDNNGNEKPTATVAALSMLVHESGEWIKEEFVVPVVDATDARSIGSAATYAKRYGLQGLLGIASEDDDCESARGGQHEMKDKEQKGPCPLCGAVGTIIKGKAEYGGGWLCWKKEGGCGAKWPDGPYPSAAPEEIPMPKEKLPVEGKPAGEPEKRPSDPQPSQPRAGSTKKWHKPGQPIVIRGDSAPSQAGQASTEAPAEPAPQAQRPAGVGDASRPVVTFEVDGASYTTNGMNHAQFLQSMELVRQMDEKVARGAGRMLLAEVLGVPVKKASRTDCTEAKAADWIGRMEKALEGR